MIDPTIINGPVPMLAPVGPPSWSQGPPGPPGPQGTPGAPSTIPGPPGTNGTNGARGSLWFQGYGPPTGAIAGALPQDQYLDISTGDVYVYS